MQPPETRRSRKRYPTGSLSYTCKIAAALFASACSLFSPQIEAQEIDTPLRLLTQYNDTLNRVAENDDFEIRNVTLQEDGRAKIETNGRLSYRLSGGPWLVVDLKADFFESNADHQTETHLRVSMSAGATDWLVRLHKAPETKRRFISIHDIKGINESTWKKVAESELPSGFAEDLKLSYRYGMVEVFGKDNAQTIVKGFLQNRDAKPTAFSLEVKRGSIVARRLKVKSSPDSVIGKDAEKLATEANDLFRKAMRLERSRQFTQAVEAGDREIEIRSKMGGQAYQIARTLGDQAYRYRDLFLLDLAEQNEQKSLTTKLNLFGENHPLVGLGYNNLGVIYKRMGDYPRAMTHYRAATEIWEKTIGKNHLWYSNGLNNIGVLYLELNQFELAEPQLVKSLEIRRRLLGRKHPMITQSLSQLGELHADMGDFDKALQIQQECAEQWKAQYGENHYKYGTELSNLAESWFKKGDFERAETFYEQALQIRKKALGADHPYYAVSLANKAILHQERKQYEEAEKLFNESAEVRKASFGEQHFNYASVLRNYSRLLAEQGKLVQAKRLMNQCAEIRRKLFGKQDSTYADAVYHLGMIAEQENDAAATRYYQQAAQIQREFLNRSSLVQSERQQKLAQAKHRHYLDHYISNALRGTTSAKDIAETIWQWKGAVTIRQQTYRQVSRDPESAKLLDKLKTLSSSLSTHVRRVPVPPADEDKEKQKAYEKKHLGWQSQFDRLNESRESLEKRLAQLKPDFSSSNARVSIADIQAALPPKSALIDFFAYRHRTPEQSSRNIFDAAIESRFLAIVVPRSGLPSVIELGSSKQISDLITRFRTQIGSVSQKLDAGTTLRSLLWEPIANRLPDNLELLLISPDTTIGQLPFAAMPGGQPGSYLIEDYKLARLSLARALLQLKAAPSAAVGEGLLVVGDVDYSWTSNRSPALVEPRQSETSMASLRNNTVRNWKSLPGFEEEKKSILAVYQNSFGADSKTNVLTGAAATENLFLNAAKDKRIVHFISHGFFEDASVKPIRSSFDQQESKQYVRTWLPGLLSGLVMAGANANPSTDNDGILHAAEIESQSFEKVELVVLSACDTGLGEVAGGEGLTGLQRAFQVAGAKSVIASLWKVEDRATRNLMEKFYSNLWDKKMTKVDALREAQLWMLRNADDLNVPSTALAGRGEPRKLNVAPKTGSAKSSSKSARTKPYFWAAFQLSGDWR